MNLFVIICSKKLGGIFNTASNGERLIFFGTVMLGMKTVAGTSAYKVCALAYYIITFIFRLANEWTRNIATKELFSFNLLHTFNFI